jgi:hypothetical protein
MQRQRRLRELLQQKQQRQQQRLQPGLGQQKQQRQQPTGSVQQQPQQRRQQQLEGDSDDEEEGDPCPSEQCFPAPVPGMQQRTGPQQDEQQQQQQQRWQMQHAERTAQADWQQLQQQLQHQDGSSDLPHAAGWAAHDSQLSPRTAAAAVAYGRNSSSYPQQQQQQQQQHVMQEPSLASGLGLAAADVAVACMSSATRRTNMQPAHAATGGSSGAASCYSPNNGIAQQRHSSAADRLQPGQLAGLLPAHLSVGHSNSSYNGGVGQEDEEAAAYEARLVAKVLEMERSMQALESQLMHVGCSDTE